MFTIHPLLSALAWLSVPAFRHVSSGLLAKAPNSSQFISKASCLRMSRSVKAFGGLTNPHTSVHSCNKPTTTTAHYFANTDISAMARTLPNPLLQFLFWLLREHKSKNLPRCWRPALPTEPLPKPMCDFIRGLHRKFKLILAHPSSHPEVLPQHFRGSPCESRP